MVSKGASSTYVRPKRKPLYVNNYIDEINILEVWEFGDIFRWKINDRKALCSENDLDCIFTL